MYVSFCCNKQQELIKLRELSRFQEEHGHSFGRRERHDSTDSIEDSMEIKRLRSEISKLQVECQHWKSIANGVVSRKPSNVICVCRYKKVAYFSHLGHLMHKRFLQNCHLSFGSICPVVSHTPLFMQYCDILLHSFFSNSKVTGAIHNGFYNTGLN